MSELTELRVFTQLVESHSATQAAQRLGIAVSAVSRRLKDLEQRLGVQLIYRTTRRMHLTAAGELYYQRARRILDDFEQAQYEVTQTTQELVGRLKIAAPVSFGLQHLSSMVAQFMTTHPKLTIELDMSDRQVDLVAEGFDVAVRIGTLQDSSLKARLIAPITHQVCAAPAFWQHHGYPQSPGELALLPALFYSNLRQPDVWPYWDKHGQGQSVALKNMRLSASNGDVLKEAAILGLGVVCEPSFIVYNAINEGTLEPVLTDYRWYGMNMYAVYPQTRHLSVKVRTFIDHLMHTIGETPYWERDVMQSHADARE